MVSREVIILGGGIIVFLLAFSDVIKKRFS